VAEPFPASLQAALADLSKWLEVARIPSMIIGGIAASALGRPKLTQDIDALAIVPETEWANTIDSASRYGIVPRIDVEDIRGLLAAHPQANVAEARRWIKEFSIAMSMSDMLEEFDRLVAQRTPET
jgi:hypothetical protein